MRVHVVAPERFDHPGQPTGGNIYDRRICAGLAEAGWDVLVTTVAAAWPVPDSGARADLARIVSAVPDGETVLIDGLIASPAAVGGLPEALGSTADGTRPGRLVPPGDPAALAAALGDWLGDERHRRRLRAAARQRRSTLRGWEQTTQEIANALTADGCRKPVPPGVNLSKDASSYL